MTTTALSPAALEAARRHSRRGLNAGVAPVSAGHIATVTVATVVARPVVVLRAHHPESAREGMG
jgi:hypothetical protein